MKNEPIDPRRERLIAYLYGEMTEEETRSFARTLEDDPALRLDFEELRGAREILADWKVAEPTPSFVFLNDTSRPSTGRPSWWKSFSLFRGAGGFGLGLATAAAAAMIMAATGFRMERVDGGLAFRFGDEKETALPVSERLSPVGQSPVRTESLELAANRSTAPASDAHSGDYITRAEFEKLSGQMVGSVVDLLNEYGNQQNHEVTGVLQAMYAQLSDRQSRDSEEARHRMSALGVELLLRQAKAGRASPGELRMQPTSIEQTDIVSPWKTMEWKEEWR